MNENMVNNVLYLIGELPTSLIIMGVALWMWKMPPKYGEIGGYNTKRSRKSTEAWDFAQTAYGRYATITFAVVSAATLAVGLSTLFMKFGEIAGFVTFMAVTGGQVAALFVIIAVIERQLKEKFDEDGKPKG